MCAWRGSLDLARKETYPRTHDIADPAAADAFPGELIDDMSDAVMPVEVRSLAGTRRRCGPRPSPDTPPESATDRPKRSTT